jgi:nucleoid-associated protein YgaU
VTLVKASIRSTAGDATLQCALNPSDYSISTGADWRATPVSGAATAPTPEFIGTKARTLRMKLLFDAWAVGASDVSSYVNQLVDWTNPTANSISQGKPCPPLLAFAWGQNAYFDAYLSSVDAQYTLFSPDGKPLRASVTVSLVEVPNEPGRQNPTSGGAPGNRTAVVAAGDTLHSIAFSEYGQPRLWRGLAAANGIDDPLRLAIGTTLLVPPRDEVARLS